MRSTPGRCSASRCAGVRVLPRAVSYAIGHVGTWLAWRLMRADDRSGCVEPAADLSRRQPRVARAQSAQHLSELRGRHDRLSARACRRLREESQRHVRSASGQRAQIFERVLAEGRGALLVAGHFGNWEIGGLLMGRVLKLPLTIVAMAEADPEVNRLRNETRAAMGVETLEVRQSLGHGAADPPHARGQSRRRVAGRSARRPRSRRGLAAWATASGFCRRRRCSAISPARHWCRAFSNVSDPADSRRLRSSRSTSIAACRDIDAMQQATQQVATALESRVRLKPHLWYHFYPYWDTQHDDGRARADCDGHGSRVACRARLQPGPPATKRERAERHRSRRRCSARCRPTSMCFCFRRGWDRYMVAHESGTHSVAGALVCAALAAGLIAIGLPCSPLRGHVRGGGHRRRQSRLVRCVFGRDDPVVVAVRRSASQQSRCVRDGRPLVGTATVLAALVIWWRRDQRARIAAIFAAALLFFVAGRSVMRIQAQATFAAQVRARR